MNAEPELSDIRDDVLRALDTVPDGVDRFDVPAIVNDFVEEIGIARYDLLDEAGFWAILTRHRRT